MVSTVMPCLLSDMTLIYVGLGSNLGDKSANLEQALLEIERQIGPLVSRSVFLCSEPWGFDSPNSFVNAAAGFLTDKNPSDTLHILKSIEKRMGRPEKLSDGYQDRIIDLDILFYGSETLEEEQLIIPHPYLHQRNFVLIPLAEIAPDLVHPVFKKTMLELLDEFNAQS